MSEIGLIILLRPPPPARQVIPRLGRVIMQRTPMFVTKKLTCPGCGAENRVRFVHSEIMIKLP